MQSRDLIENTKMSFNFNFYSHSDYSHIELVIEDNAFVTFSILSVPALRSSLSYSGIILQGLKLQDEFTNIYF